MTPPSEESRESVGRPTRVNLALLALGGAWLASAAGLFVNQVVNHGSGIGPGPSLGIVSLLVQGVMIFFVARGNPVGRGLVVFFAILATLPLQLVPRLMAQHELFSASYTVLGFVLKAAAVWLLFAGAAKKWFARDG